MTPSMTVTPSKGFAFSISMLVFMLIEIGVLADIERQYINTMILLLFAGLGLLALLRFAGILLVAAGHYRVGGVIQIVASAVHALESIGLLGIFGGLAAYRIPSVWPNWNGAQPRTARSARRSQGTGPDDRLWPIVPGCMLGDVC